MEIEEKMFEVVLTFNIGKEMKMMKYVVMAIDAGNAFEVAKAAILNTIQKINIKECSKSFQESLSKQTKPSDK